MNLNKRLLVTGCIFIGIILSGVIGYMAIEHWSFLDALFMTVTTITTVGYNEVHPLSINGQVFSIFLIVGGVGGALYALTGIMTYVVEGQFGSILWRRRMKAKISKLKGHFILCGYGSVGEDIARTFKEEAVPFVVIDNKPDCVSRLEQDGHLFIEGDATSDEVLKAAGIEAAHGLVAAVGSDVDNAYITLSARGLYPNLFITARASGQEAVSKLERVGANRIVSPHSIGGRRMAMLALRPAVVDFIDNVTSIRGREVQLENVDVDEQSRLVGATVKAARSGSGVTVLAMQKKMGEILSNPPDEEIIEAGDRIFIIGTRKRLAALEESLGGQAAAQ